MKEIKLTEYMKHISADLIKYLKYHFWHLITLCDALKHCVVSNCQQTPKTYFTIGMFSILKLEIVNQII